MEEVSRLTNELATARVTEAEYISELDQPQVTLQMYRNSLQSMNSSLHHVGDESAAYATNMAAQVRTAVERGTSDLREFGITSRTPTPLTSVLSNATPSITSSNPTNCTSAGHLRNYIHLYHPRSRDMLNGQSHSWKRKR